eukprot:2884707-Amphidinium_carterae.1
MKRLGPPCALNRSPLPSLTHWPCTSSSSFEGAIQVAHHAQRVAGVLLSLPEDDRTALTESPQMVSVDAILILSSRFCCAMRM